MCLSSFFPKIAELLAEDFEDRSGPGLRARYIKQDRFYLDKTCFEFGLSLFMLCLELVKQSLALVKLRLPLSKSRLLLGKFGVLLRKSGPLCTQKLDYSVDVHQIINPERQDTFSPVFWSIRVNSWLNIPVKLAIPIMVDAEASAVANRYSGEGQL